MVPCIGETPARPGCEINKLLITATNGEVVLALARDWPRGRKYEEELEAIISGCK